MTHGVRLNFSSLITDLYDVNPRSPQPWIPLERIEALVQLEPALITLAGAVIAWAIYKLFLGDTSEERHQSLKRQFTNLGTHVGLATFFYLAYVALQRAIEASDVGPGAAYLAGYIGLAAVFTGLTVFIKTWRIFVSEYLFLGHMKVRVPLLLVNLFTLLFTIAMVGWVVSHLFSINLAPLLATSAIFSLVLGLALQDTLGNLFAGVALQIDKPYELGDWIEIHSDSSKWVGQVFEVTWRATVLTGLSDEALTIPNRVMAQAKISNYSLKTRPFIRSQMFRIPYGTPIERVKDRLMHVADSTPEIRKTPRPLVLLSETTESWMTFKLVYFLDDYASQFMVADRVSVAVIDTLAQDGISFAAPRIALTQESPALRRASV